MSDVIFPTDASITTKASPIGADKLLIADSEDGWATKDADISTLPFPAMQADTFQYKNCITVGSSNADYITDGTADEIQIQEAIDALGGPGTVIVKSGTYDIASHILIESSGVQIIGMGLSTIFNNTSTTGGHCFVSNNTDAGNPYSNVIFRDFKVVGNSLSGDAFNLKGCADNSEISNVRTYLGSRGIYLYNCWSMRMDNVYIDHSVGDGIYADLANNDQMTWNNVWVIGAGGRGLYSEGGVAWTVNSFNASLCGSYGIQLKWGGDKIFNSAYFETNGNSDIILGDGSGGSEPHNVEINKSYHVQWVNSGLTAININDGREIYINVPEFNETVGVGYGTFVYANTHATNCEIKVKSGDEAKITNISSTTLIKKFGTIDFLDTDGTLSANSDSKIPSQKAVKTYSDTKSSLTADNVFSGTQRINSRIGINQSPHATDTLGITANSTTYGINIAKTNDGGGIYIESSVIGGNDYGLFIKKTGNLVSSFDGAIYATCDNGSTTNARTIQASHTGASGATLHTSASGGAFPLEINNTGTAVPIKITPGTNGTATSATAGSNGAVPAQVTGYLVINIGGTNYKIPYFPV